jgi:hypothetical protein
VLALAEVAVDLALSEFLSRLRAVADLARLPLLDHLAALAHLAPLPREADLAEEEVSLEALHRSFSAAMVGNLPSAATPRCSPVPRSGRKANRRP